MYPASTYELSPVHKQRREYFREKQRQHRRKDKDEILLLQQELHGLETQARELNLPRASSLQGADDQSLSWQIISSVFRRESKLALVEKEALVDDATSKQMCLLALERFVATYQPIPNVASWGQLFRHAALPAHPQARRFAKQWLTQQMYHNTEPVLARLPVVVDPTESFASFDVEFDGPCVNILEHSQMLLPCPLRSAIDMLRHRLNGMWQFDPSKLRTETEDNTTFYRYSSQPQDVSWNVLGAYFHEADRCVMVFRRVQADEAEAGFEPRHAMEWCDLRRISATETSMRSFCIMSQGYANDEFLPLDAIAAAHGLDLTSWPTEAAKREALKMCVLEKARASSSEYLDRMLRELVAAS
ncbi:Aste57867_23798 [Aphanomyces stellatus]|uniref:Aste57867_23798 protein n=1 Tax=Aphanomyces stellatus TaxID=120398 RepID=A0A485LQH7_9STRA|nr:hypothetical protein As57867_023725 [Aphanomyces stellatus]VFU00443.1 Aste57867_23798 [Aphanomyces stellatus]